jgi:DNA-directed RNA polymerase subunit beta
LVKELQALGLDIRVLDMDHHQIDLRDMDENNEHFSIDHISRMAEQQEKKKLEAEEKAQDPSTASDEAASDLFSDQPAPADDPASDDNSAK